MRFAVQQRALALAVAEHKLYLTRERASQCVSRHSAAPWRRTRGGLRLPHGREVNPEVSKEAFCTP